MLPFDQNFRLRRNHRKIPRVSPLDRSILRLHPKSLRKIEFKHQGVKSWSIRVFFDHATKYSMVYIEVFMNIQ